MAKKNWTLKLYDKLGRLGLWLLAAIPLTMAVITNLIWQLGLILSWPLKIIWLKLLQPLFFFMVKLVRYRVMNAVIKPKFLVWALAILSLVILLLTAGYIYLTHFPASKRATVAGEYIVVVKDSTPKDIAELLAKEKIIDQPQTFYWLSRFATRIEPFKHGQYRFDQNLSWLELIALLQAGQEQQVRITVLEGWRAAEIFAALRASEIQNDGRYEDHFYSTALLGEIGEFDIPPRSSIEGFLFPDTYYIPVDFSEFEVLQLMINNFKQKIPPQLTVNDHGKPLSPYEILTLASIIEKETSLKDDKLLVSSVFHNRLKSNIRLQADPTVIYGSGRFSRAITKSDLRAKNSYNTYVIDGLPRTPISNPGLDSWLAALNPAKTEYFYFVAIRNSARSQFSKTLREHINAVNRYRRGT